MHDSIFFKRHSKRSYLDKEVPEEILKKLFEIVRWTPSCANNQPWRMVFSRSGETREKFNAAMSRGNEWMHAAPVMVAIFARESDDAVRDDDPVKYYQFDSGMACLSLLLGAVEHGLMAHPTAGWDAFKVKEALGIPEEYHVLCIVALGYEGPIEQLDERTYKKDAAERTRKPVEEIISFDRFDF